MTIAKRIKEDYSYVCQDIVKEFRKYDLEPYKYFQRFEGEHSVTGRVSLYRDSANEQDLISIHRNIRSMLDMKDSWPPRSSSTLRFILAIS